MLWFETTWLFFLKTMFWRAGQLDFDSFRFLLPKSFQGMGNWARRISALTFDIHWASYKPLAQRCRPSFGHKCNRLEKRQVVCFLDAGKGVDVWNSVTGLLRVFFNLFKWMFECFAWPCFAFFMLSSDSYLKNSKTFLLSNLGGRKPFIIPRPCIPFRST